MQTPPASSDFLATWLIHAESSWASYHLYELTRAEPERAWACVETLCAEGLSERERDELCRTVGDLMRAHGERFIDRAERLAAENETFRKCLRKAVWSSGDTELEQRARAAARIRWTLGGRTPSPNLSRLTSRWSDRPLHRGGELAGMIVYAAKDPRAPRVGSLITAIDGRRFASWYDYVEILAEVPESHEPVLEIERVYPLVAAILEGWAPDPVFEPGQHYGLRVRRAFPDPAGPHLAVPVGTLVTEINGVRIRGIDVLIEVLTSVPDLASLELTLAEPK